MFYIFKYGNFKNKIIFFPIQLYVCWIYCDRLWLVLSYIIDTTITNDRNRIFNGHIDH